MQRPYAPIGLAALCLVLAGNLLFFLQSSNHGLPTFQPAHRITSLRLLEQKNQELALALQTANTALATTANPSHNPPLATANSPYAYVFYATAPSYACSALVNIAHLRTTLSSTLPTHVLLPDASSNQIPDSYIAAFSALNTTIHRVTIPHPTSASQREGYYRDCFLKLLVFKLHRLPGGEGLKRVLLLDSDQLILRNLDHLFADLPSADLAAPRAYWLDGTGFTSTFLLAELSDRLWRKVERAMEAMGEDGEEWDMDVLNRVLGREVLLLSGEFAMLNSHWEDWNLPGWFRGKEGEGVNWGEVEGVNEMVEEGKEQDQRTQRSGVVGRAGVSRRRRSERRERKGVAPAGIAGLEDGQPSSPQASIHPNPDSPPNTATPLADPPPSDPSLPKPRFPSTHPLSFALYALYASQPNSYALQETYGAALLHFTAVNKPWTLSREAVIRERPDAHPLLAETVGVWWEQAEKVCPGWAGGVVPEEGLDAPGAGW